MTGSYWLMLIDADSNLDTPRLRLIVPLQAPLLFVRDSMSSLFDIYYSRPLSMNEVWVSFWFLWLIYWLDGRWAGDWEKLSAQLCRWVVGTWAVGCYSNSFILWQTSTGTGATGIVVIGLWMCEQAHWSLGVFNLITYCLNIGVEWE